MGEERTQGKCNEGKTAFLEVNDGSCLDNIQVIVGSKLWLSLSDLTHTGTSVHVEGQLVMPPESNKNQIIEVKVSRILSVGIVEDPDRYPVYKGKIPMEHLRNVPHLRCRTHTLCYTFSDL